MLTGHGEEHITQRILVPLMRKLSDNKKWWLMRQAAIRRHAERIRSRKPSPRGVPSVRLPVGKDCCSMSKFGFDACSVLVARMRSAAQNGARRIVLDFTHLQSPLAATVLRLHAEAEYVCAFHPGTRITFVAAAQSNTEKLLKRSRFLRSAETHQERPAGLLPITRCIGRPRLQDLFRKMNESIYGGKVEIDDDEWQQVSGALAEAVNNVQDHAYDHEERELYVKRLGARWWIYAETIRNELWLAVYDKGIGIPEMVPRKRPSVLSLLRTALPGQSRDALLLEAALLDSESRFSNLPHAGGHGKGLGRIQRLAKAHPNGRLFIASGNGLVQANNQGYHTHGLEHRVHGTLIQWNISILSSQGAT